MGRYGLSPTALSDPPPALSDSSLLALGLTLIGEKPASQEVVRIVSGLHSYPGFMSLSFLISGGLSFNLLASFVLLLRSCVVLKCIGIMFVLSQTQQRTSHAINPHARPIPSFKELG